MASLGLDLGDDDMLNDGNDGSAPLADCVDGTAPPIPSASAGTSGEGGAADASEAICTQSTLLSGSRSAPHARAPATVGVCGTVGATPGTTWSNGAYTRRSPQARSPAPRRALAANPNPTDDAISRRRVRHHRARSLPAAGGVHPVWARGGHVTDTWPRLYFVKNVLLIGVFTEQTFFRGAAEGGKPILQDGFRAKTILFPTYQDLTVKLT